MVPSKPIFGLIGQQREVGCSFSATWRKKSFGAAYTGRILLLGVVLGRGDAVVIGGGQVCMPLAPRVFARKFGWAADKLGVL